MTHIFGVDNLNLVFSSSTIQSSNQHLTSVESLSSLLRLLDFKFNALMSLFIIYASLYLLLIVTQIVSYNLNSTKSFNFLVIGNWATKSKEIDTSPEEIATAIGSWAFKKCAQFVVTVGDNFNPNGVTSVEDPKWNIEWKKAYIENHIGLQIPWYPVLGDADYVSGMVGANAAVERSSIDPQIWKMKDFNYMQTFIWENNSIISIVFIDTHSILAHASFYRPYNISTRYVYICI